MGDVLPLGRLLAAIVAVAVLSAAPTASAEPGYFVAPAERLSQLSVRGTHGFEITVRRFPRRVELIASRGTASAIYIVRPKRGPADGIKATFPGLGRIAVRFVPSGRVQRGRAFCEGRPWSTQHGIFTGSIRFEGEREFTRVDLRDARGFVHHRSEEVCEDTSGGPAGEPPFYFLEAGGWAQGRATALTALKPIDESQFGSSVQYFASQWEKRHGMTISRLAAVAGDLDTFVIAGPPRRPESVTISPPPPFSGSATFRAVPGAAPEWTGMLAVELPGVGTVQLTGPQFRPTCCRD